MLKTQGDGPPHAGQAVDFCDPVWTHPTPFPLQGLQLGPVVVLFPLQTILLCLGREKEKQRQALGSSHFPGIWEEAVWVTSRQHLESVALCESCFLREFPHLLRAA